MIRYICNTEIDRGKWDRCVGQSANGRVYAFSWYLDLVSPGWDALEQDDYATVFPLTGARRFGIRYLRQPFFTQQLGLFSVHPVSRQMVTDFLRAIPPVYRFAEIQLNQYNPVDDALFDVRLRRNHELSLSPGYENLASSYSQNTRRNIRKAANLGVSVNNLGDSAGLVRLFRRNYGKREDKLCRRDYGTINRLIGHCLETGKGILLSAGTAESPLDAAAFFLKDGNRFVFLFSASDFATRKNGAMFLLLDTFIREHSGNPLILDFEGGRDPDLGRFYKSFGAAETNYPCVRMNRMPGWMNLGWSLWKWMRRR